MVISRWRICASHLLVPAFRTLVQNHPLSMKASPSPGCENDEVHGRNVLPSKVEFLSRLPPLGTPAAAALVPAPACAPGCSPSGGTQDARPAAPRASQRSQIACERALFIFVSAAIGGGDYTLGRSPPER